MSDDRSLTLNTVLEGTLGLVVGTLGEEGTLISDGVVGRDAAGGDVGATGGQVGGPDLRELLGSLDGSRGAGQRRQEVGHLEGDGRGHGSRSGEGNKEAGDLHLEMWLIFLGGFSFKESECFFEWLMCRGLHRQGGSKNEGCLGLDLYAVLTKIEGREERQVEDGGRTPSV